MPDRDFIERIWYATDGFAAATRIALSPFERIFRGVVGARDMLYDAGLLPLHDTAIPALSVGNLTVGGTGKTPVAAWIAGLLAARGARPAIVLRGYGDDEPLVHGILNPGIPVITGSDRVGAIATAAERGASVAVLDDAFQHRRARRAADIVLVSADRWTPEVHMLPVGPWREPLEALRRASMVIVTRKAAADAVVEAVHERLSQVAPVVPRIGARLVWGPLVRADDPSETQSLDGLAGARVHAVLSIADPQTFIAQLEQCGARVEASIYGDHHTFSGGDVSRIVAVSSGADRIVCTLKDAVKLGPLWPRLASPLWYVSQRVVVERGVGGIERMLDDFVGAHPKNPASSTAG